MASPLHKGTVGAFSVRNADAFRLRELGNDGRQRAAGTVAADGQAIGIHADLRRVLDHPGGGREGVVERGGIFVLRREAVIDRDHAHSAFIRHHAA